MASSPRRSRLLVVTSALFIGAGSLAPVSADTTVASATVVDAAAGYLAEQLSDGDHLEGDFGPLYGPTADVAFGLLAAGSQPDTVTDVLDFLTTDEAVDAYVHGQPFDGQTVDDPAYVGATAKLGLLATVAGLDARATGGTDLVATLQSLEQPSGRFEDRSDYGSFANLFGQAFALLFLTAAEDVAPSIASVETLVQAQCDDGGFPQDWDQDTCTSQPDATGLVVQALALAGDGVAGVDAALAEAATWLEDTRDGDGAWGEPRNTNSTAYAGMGLLSLAADVSTTQSFLTSIQNGDGGLPISPGDDSDPIATAQALPLLASSSFTALVDGPGIPTPDGVERIAGADRIETAVAISREMFRTGGASTVVLARHDEFADGLAAVPLAAQRDGALLLTPPSHLDERVLAEIQRVLSAGATVHLVGGDQALGPAVRQPLEDAGYAVVRVAGADRWSTSVAVAQYLDDPDFLVLATGLDFPDAMAAGAAAGARGAVLLTAGTEPAPAVATYLRGRSGAEVVAIGGPAAAAHPDAEAVVGEDRDATATAVAARFFDRPAYVGVARRDVFADALTGAVQAARLGAPLLLAGRDDVGTTTGQYLCSVGDGVTGAAVWGGPAAVGDSAVATVAARLAGTGC